MPYRCLLVFFVAALSGCALHHDRHDPAPDPTPDPAPEPDPGLPRTGPVLPSPARS